MLRFCFLFIVVYLKVEVSQMGLLGQKIIGFVILIAASPVTSVRVYKEIVCSTSIAIEHLMTLHVDTVKFTQFFLSLVRNSISVLF